MSIANRLPKTIDSESVLDDLMSSPSPDLVRDLEGVRATS